MFSGTLALVEDCGLPILHVFPYSPRPGTPAARMPQVARDVAKDRARRLREAGAAALARHLDGEVGRRRRVLTETADIGRTEHFTAVRFEGAVAPGQIVEAHVTGHDGSRLIGASSGSAGARGRLEQGRFSRDRHGRAYPATPI